MLQLVVLAILVAGGFYVRSVLRGDKEPRAEMNEEQIRQQWRQLGFFCEVDEQKRIWTLTGSRAGLLYFPDLLLGYVNDPANAVNNSHRHYDPYGSLEVVTWVNPIVDGHAIRGSLDDLTRLAELVEAKLASAQPGEIVRIRDEYSPNSPFALLLDVREDGFDPASTDRERLGAAKPTPPPPDSPRQKPAS